MRIKPFIYIFSLLFLLAACTLRASVATPQSIQNPAFTSAAETINAQLTDIALPAGTSTPEVEVSNTNPAVTIEPSPIIETEDISPSPESTEVVLLTEPATPSATPLPPTKEPAAYATDDPRYILGEPDWQEPFDNAANWPIYSDENVEMEVVDGNLSMTATNANQYEAWMLTQDWVSDIYLEAEVTTGACRGMDRYGVLLRAQSASQGYLFGFTCDGKFSIRNWNGQTFLLLTQWKPSEHIRKGADQTNLIGVRVEGDQLSLYANGKLLVEITDTTYSSGAFGPFVSAYSTPGFNVKFSDISYWVID